MCLQFCSACFVCVFSVFIVSECVCRVFFLKASHMKCISSLKNYRHTAYDKLFLIKILIGHMESVSSSPKEKMIVF